jgi:hypothetical protein
MMSKRNSRQTRRYAPELTLRLSFTNGSLFQYASCDVFIIMQGVEPKATRGFVILVARLTTRK